MEKVRLKASAPLKYIWEIPASANVAGVDREGNKFYAVRSYGDPDHFMLIMTDSLSPGRVNDLLAQLIFDNWTSVHEKLGDGIRELYTFDERKEMYKWLSED